MSILEQTTVNEWVILAGVLLELLILRNTWLAYRSRRWLQVPGRVVASSFEEAGQAESEGGSSVSCRPKIKYTYDHAGKTYVGKRIAYSIMFGTKASAERLVRNFRSGKTIKVYIHPRNPGHSVLLTGIDAAPAFIALVAPPVFVFISLLVVREMGFGRQ